MNKLHNLSSITVLPELDLFSLPPTQLSIEKNIVTEHRPISVLDSNSIIEFNINSGIDEYIQLKDMLLYMKIKVDIKKTGNANIVEDDWKKIGPVGNVMHSLFKAVDLEINGKSITLNPQTYAYKAYFETLLGCTVDAKQSHLSASGFIQENTDDQSALTEVVSTLIRPNPITTDGKGKSIEFTGKLFLDMAQQPKPLIGGCQIKITLVPNNPSFYLWCTDPDITASVTFESSCLYVTKSKISMPVVEAHNVAISNGTAKYPITRGYVKAFTVNNGALDVSLDNVFSGQIPRRLFVALVDNKGFNGDISENPFNFKPFNLNYITASVDGIQYPTVAYTPNFDKNLYMREFVGLFETLNSLSSDSVLTINRDEYKKGFVIYGFNLGNDNCDDCHKAGFLNVIKQGAVRLQMKFANALTSNVTILVYGEFDNLVEIDSTRSPITDYI